MAFQKENFVQYVQENNVEAVRSVLQSLNLDERLEILSKKLDYHTCNHKFKTNAFMYAAEQYNFSGMVKEMLSLAEGEAFNMMKESGSYGWTALMLAAMRSSPATIRELLTVAGQRAPELLKQKKKNGWNALLIATRYSSDEKVKELLSFIGRDDLTILQEKNDDGHSAFEYAVRFGSTEKVQDIILALGANFSKVAKLINKSGENALIISVFGGSEIFLYRAKLILNSVSTEVKTELMAQKNSNGHNALMIAIQCGNKNFVELFCNNGAVIDDASLEYARYLNKPEIVNYLLVQKEQNLQRVSGEDSVVIMEGRIGDVGNSVGAVSSSSAMAAPVSQQYAPQRSDSASQVSARQAVQPVQLQHVRQQMTRANGDSRQKSALGKRGHADSANASTSQRPEKAARQPIESLLNFQIMNLQNQIDSKALDGVCESLINSRGEQISEQMMVVLAQKGLTKSVDAAIENGAGITKNLINAAKAGGQADFAATLEMARDARNEVLRNPQGHAARIERERAAEGLLGLGK